MKRSGFKRKVPAPHAATQCGYTPRAREVAVARSAGVARLCVPIPKEVIVRHQALREAYRELPCQYERDGGGLCGLMDGTVCCNHANWSIFGKAGARKASDDRGASGCSRHHYLLDQGREWSEAEKKARWWGAHVRTVRLLVSLGHWPGDVPVPDIETNPFEVECDALTT